MRTLALTAAALLGLASVAAHPDDLSCSRGIAAGETIMGSPVTESTAAWTKLKKDSSVIECGGQIEGCACLTVEFTSTSDASNQYVLELEGAKFMNGRCDGKRVENDASKQMVDVPRAAGTLKVRAAWSGTDMTVKVTSDCSYTIVAGDRSGLCGCEASGTQGGTGGGGGGGGVGGSATPAPSPSDIAFRNSFLALVAAAVLLLIVLAHVKGQRKHGRLFALNDVTSGQRKSSPLFGLLFRGSDCDDLAVAAPA